LLYFQWLSCHDFFLMTICYIINARNNASKKERSNTSLLFIIRDLNARNLGADELLGCMLLRHFPFLCCFLFFFKKSFKEIHALICTHRMIPDDLIKLIWNAFSHNINVYKKKHNYSLLMHRISSNSNLEKINVH
jgi:hypothetical protein